MKIALLTDTHAGARNNSSAFHDNAKLFYEYFYNYLDENNIKTIVHLGDILDNRNNTNTYTAKRLREDLIDPAIDRKIDWHQILGNHDLYFKNVNSVNSFSQLFSKYPLNIYENCTEVVFDNVKILFVPWINPENKDRTFNLIKNTKAQICFGHLEIQGFQMYKGSIISHGENRASFSKFDLVCSGHYHHRSTEGNITYIGSGLEFTWADYDDPRGFSVFDTETRKLEFIKNPFNMFIKFEYDDHNSDSIDCSIFNKKYVKITVKNKSNQLEFDKFIDKLYQCNPLELQIMEKSIAEFTVNELKDEGIEIESSIDIINSYIENTEYDTKIKNNLKNYLIELYQSAISLE